jgi:hypothetical protein
MRGAIPPLHHYAFMTRYLVKKEAQGQLYVLPLPLLTNNHWSLIISDTLCEAVLNFSGDRSVCENPKLNFIPYPMNPTFGQLSV